MANQNVIKSSGISYYVDFKRDLVAKKKCSVDSWYVNLFCEVDGKKVGFTWHQGTIDAVMLKMATIEICMMEITENIWFSEATAEKVSKTAYASYDKLDVQTSFGGLTGDEKEMHLKVKTSDGEIDVKLRPQEAMLVNGGSGLINLYNMCDSKQFSWPNMLANGTFTLKGRTYKIENATAWFDRQWGTNLSLKDFASSKDGLSWMWIGMNPSTGKEGIGAFSIWDTFVKGVRNTFATVVAEGGAQLYAPAEITYSDIWVSKETGNKYPKRFHVSVPAADLELDFVCLAGETEFVHKYGNAGSQSPFSITGTMKGQTINASMIVEMIGGVQTIG